ncbi:MAG: alpha/beta fold hydrolase [Arenimonas sp.]
MKPFAYMAFVLMGIAIFICGPARADSRIVSQTEQQISIGENMQLTINTGMIEVLELHADAGENSKKIELAFIRIQRGSKPGKSAHLILAGGPGDSGVKLVQDMVQQGGADFMQIFDADIIGIDQRGTGKSIPNLASDVRYELPLDQPASPELWLPIIEQANAKVAASFRSKGIRLEAYNTRESADDVDDIRQALGYEKLTLWGRSYGSHLALAVLRQHSTSIERMVLVSPEGPNHTWKLPSQADVVLHTLSERMNEPDLFALMQSVMRRLKKTPVKVEVVDPASNSNTSVVIGALDLQLLTIQALGNPRAIQTLPAAYRKMAGGDFSAIAPLVLMYRKQLGVQSAMKQMMDLSSGASAERRLRIKSEAQDSVLGMAFNFPTMYLADIWKPEDLGDEFRAAVASDVPTMILVGELDPRTPVANAREIAATLPNAKIEVIQNAAHQFDLFGSPQLREKLIAFLKSGK